MQADDQRQGVAGAGSRRESATHGAQEDARGTTSVQSEPHELAANQFLD